MVPGLAEAAVALPGLDTWIWRLSLASGTWTGSIEVAWCCGNTTSGELGDMGAAILVGNRAGG
jgi:hypothetical protein